MKRITKLLAQPMVIALLAGVTAWCLMTGNVPRLPDVGAISMPVLSLSTGPSSPERLKQYEQFLETLSPKARRTEAPSFRQFSEDIEEYEWKQRLDRKLEQDNEAWKAERDRNETAKRTKS